MKGMGRSHSRMLGMPDRFARLFDKGWTAPLRFYGSQATTGNAAVDVGVARCGRKGHRGRKYGATSCSRCTGNLGYGTVEPPTEVRLWLPSESVSKNSGLSPRSTS